MSKNTAIIANNVKIQFEKLAKTDVTVTFIQMGKMHKPTPLPAGCCGVYVFGNDKCSFKVGKAGPKSKPRWTSHHYKLIAPNRSTLPKSILINKGLIKKYYPLKKHHEIDSLCSANIKQWIKENMFRIEILIECKENDRENQFALNLLEALAQFHFKPIFEGPQKLENRNFSKKLSNIGGL